jgi:hypothetical protein
VDAVDAVVDVGPRQVQVFGVVQLRPTLARFQFWRERKKRTFLQTAGANPTIFEFTATTPAL